MDLSKCTHLVNGWELKVQPERSNPEPKYPWQCVVINDEGRYLVITHTDAGIFNEEENGEEFDDWNLQLPEPEWVYIRMDSGYVIQVHADEATHRFIKSDPLTIERYIS